MTINPVTRILLIPFRAVPITAGYAESEVFYSSMVWYDRSGLHAGMKRSHHSLDTYPIMDPCSYYGHLQQPLKYMKPEPMPPYYYAEDPERYQANITVSVQSQPALHSTYGAASSSGLATSYNPMSQFSYSSSVLGSMSSTDNTGAYSLGGYNLAAMPTPQTAVYPRNVSPERSSTATVADEPASMSTPLTPPLSVSPVSGAQGSPTPPQTTASIMTSSTNSFVEKENTIGYRSASASPCMAATTNCDSTTNSELLSEKLPLHVLSDLSEGLPLPGM